MRFILIAGSRQWDKPGAVAGWVQREVREHGPFVLVTGKASGVDTFARSWALREGLWVVDVPVEGAHWVKHSLSAGHKRNDVMLHLPIERAVFFIFNESGGSEGCLANAERRGIPVEVYRRP